MKNAFLKSTLVIDAPFFIYLKAFKIESIVKCLYATKSFKCFKIRINLDVPLLFFLAKTLEIKAADSVEVSTITPFLRRGLVSVPIIPCSETLWGIQGTFGFPRKFNKSILSSFSTTSSIKQSLVMTFQFSIKFLMLLATNSDLLLLLLNEFSFCEIYCSALLSISSLEQSP